VEDGSGGGGETPAAAWTAARGGTSPEKCDNAFPATVLAWIWIGR
jgi:hypothetical protein